MARYEEWDDERRGGRGDRERSAEERTRGGEPGGREDEWRRDWRGEGRETRREIDPPWVELGPRGRQRGDTRGLVEWEDRGPLEWLGDRMREGSRERPSGPKGYKRSDERICDDVCERISRSGVDARDVEVKVENGEVTLAGTVRSRGERWRLEEVADDVFGVEEVHNQVRIARVQPGDEEASLEARARRPKDVRH